MIILPQPALATALKRLFFAIDAGSKLEALTRVKIDAYDNIVKLSGASRRISAEALIQVDTPRVGRLTFGTTGALLRDIITSFSATSMVTLVLEGDTLFVKTPTSTFRLPVLDPGVVPASQDYSHMSFVKTDMAELLKGIRNVIFASNKEGAHDYQHGVCFNKDHIVATDGFRLVHFPNTTVPASAKGILIPKDSGESLLKMFHGIKEGGVFIDQSDMHFYGDGMYASIRQMVGEFPDYKVIMPVGKGSTYQFKRDELLVPLRRLLLVAQDKVSLFAGFSFKADLKTLILSAETMVGKGYEAVACTPQIDQAVKMNLKHVVESLDECDDTITFELFSPPQDSVILIKSGEYTHAISANAP